MSLKEILIGQQIADSEMAEQMIGVYARMEIDNLRAARDAAEAAGVNTGNLTIPDPEDRAAALLELSRAALAGDFEEYWAEQHGERWDSTPPAEWVGAGTDSATWQDQIATWAMTIRSDHSDIEATDRELANIAAKEVYGAGLDEIETQIVDIDQGQEVNRLVTGNFAAAQGLMQTVADRLADPDGTEGEGGGGE